MSLPGNNHSLRLIYLFLFIGRVQLVNLPYFYREKLLPTGRQPLISVDTWGLKGHFQLWTNCYSLRKQLLPVSGHSTGGSYLSSSDTKVTSTGLPLSQLWHVAFLILSIQKQEKKVDCIPQKRNLQALVLVWTASLTSFHKKRWPAIRRQAVLWE